MVEQIKVVPAPNPECHACGAPTAWSVEVVLDGGRLAECSECEHVTAYWNDEPES